MSPGSRVGRAPVASTGRFRAASAAVASRNSASEISDIRSATRNTSGPRGRTPMPTSGWRRPSSVEQRLDDAQLVTGTEPVFDAGQQRARGDHQHGAAEQGGRRADADELGVTRGPQQEERGRQHDQHDADGEDEQRAAAPAAVGVTHAGPRHQGQRQQHVEQRQQPRQPPVAGAEVALEVLLRRHLRLLARSEEDHQTRRRR